MREMKESGIEWIKAIPSNWNISKIDQLYVPRNTKVSDFDYQPLSVTMQGIVPQLESAAKTNAHDSRKLVMKGDFAINSRSDRRGSCGISEYTGSVSLINTVLKPKEDMNARYYNWLFHTSMFSDEFYRCGHGIVDDLWSTGWQEMKKISIPSPSLDEQHKIADFLDQKCTKIDALTADIQTQIETLEEYKKSVITEAVTKGLDPNVEMKDSGVEWIGKIPANWTVIKIKFLSNEVNQKRLMNTESMYSYLGLENLKSYSDEIIKTETDYDEGIQKFCHKGNVLFSKLRPYLAKVMICPYDTFATSEFLELSPSECVCDANYLKYSMLNSSFINEVNLSTYGAKMPRADASYIKNIKICITNLDEQHRIADFLDQKCSEIDQTISEKQQQLDTLAEYKKSLIYEYVTGKKEVA